MVVKLIIAITILIALRHHLGMLKPIVPLWPVGVGLAVGGVLGWAYAVVFIESGQCYETYLQLGIPGVVIKSASALIGALATVAPVSAAIWRLLPPNKEN